MVELGAEFIASPVGVQKVHRRRVARFLDRSEKRLERGIIRRNGPAFLVKKRFVVDVTPEGLGDREVIKLAVLGHRIEVGIAVVRDVITGRKVIEGGVEAEEIRSEMAISPRLPSGCRRSHRAFSWDWSCKARNPRTTSASSAPTNTTR